MTVPADVVTAIVPDVALAVIAAVKAVLVTTTVLMTSATLRPMTPLSDGCCFLGFGRVHIAARLCRESEINFRVFGGQYAKVLCFQETCIGKEAAVTVKVEFEVQMNPAGRSVMVGVLVCSMFANALAPSAHADTVYTYSLLLLGTGLLGVAGALRRKWFE